MIKHSLKASILASLAGSAALVIYTLPIYGVVSFAFSLVMISIAFVAALILSLPLMKLRKYIKEPYYFIIYLLFGFIGGIIAVNVTFQKAIIQPWLIFTYGSLGAICAIVAWFYLYKNIEKWYKIT